MVLKTFYKQKKATIRKIINKDKEEQERVGVSLYSDHIFKSNEYTFPFVLFKYNNVVWNTSSEKEYKADVDFSVFVIMEPSTDDYLSSFELSKRIDDAILLHPTRGDIRKNKEELLNGITDIPLTTNVAFKVREGQYNVADDYWEKNKFYIWEINYKTTLIEKEYKKRYTMLSNNFFKQSEIDGGQQEKDLETRLGRLGFDLNDYHLKEYNGKKLLIYKNVEEQLFMDDSLEIPIKK